MKKSNKKINYKKLIGKLVKFEPYGYSFDEYKNVYGTILYFDEELCFYRLLNGPFQFKTEGWAKERINQYWNNLKIKVLN